MKITYPYIISQFPYHDDIKSKMLDFIDSNDYSGWKDERSVVSKTDWNITERPYYEFLIYPLVEHMNSVFKELKYENFQISSLWFQQYTKGSNHGWHIHERSQWTSVYYLELPNSEYGTELYDPMLKKELKPQVAEGTILTMPSYIVHRSPEIKSDLRKTIISFNCDTFV
jgi:hypothetical protein